MSSVIHSCSVGLSSFIKRYEQDSHSCTYHQVMRRLRAASVYPKRVCKISDGTCNDLTCSSEYVACSKKAEEYGKKNRLGSVSDGLTEPRCSNAHSTKQS